MNEKKYIERLIEGADKGNNDDGVEALRSAALAIETGQFDSPFLPYLADCIMKYVELGVPLERAFNVEAEPSRGGKPAKYDKIEIAALDILLRKYAGKSPEEAVDWIDQHVGPDRRYVQRLRKEHDSTYNDTTSQPLMESLDRDILLHLVGAMRKNLAGVLPQT